MSIIALITKSKESDYSFQPFVSILVPTFNEENVIARRIANLLQLKYPTDRYEIIIVDSGSEDQTVEIVNTIIEKHEHISSIKLVQEENRCGKASAINYGKKFAKGEFILVTDANATFDPVVLREIMPHFKDPRVGAVGGRYCVANLENSLASTTSFYWDLEYIMRIGESAIDSACLFHGEINAWRKNLVNADIRMLSEDLDMCISIKELGYRIDYEPRAIVYEPAATTPTDQIKQRKRTSIGTIQNLFKHYKFLLFSRGWYGTLIFHSHKTLAMFSPFLLLAIPLIYLLLNNLYIIGLHIVITLGIFGILFAFLLYSKSKLILNNSDTKTKFSLSMLFKIAYYVLLNEYLILLAWKDFFLGRYSILWEKATTTR
jgi:cellulose synthase/poly-beta-1,6-N-acetylglucosamine synthase-like glycosyltransferase